MIEERAAGQGGFGRIDKAWDSVLERYLAIKTLDPIFRDATPEDRERFKREAKALASFAHTNIPAVYDVVFPDGESELRILFQWIDGITIREYLRDKGVLSLEQVRNWFGDICSALGHAHSKQIIHRDLKPSNMIVTEKLESCYLVDFGIALRASDIERLTRGSRLGTPGYMSPEQERGEELTPASDLFSLGVVLYECLAGTRPTVGKYTPLNTINEAIPPTIDELVQRCLLDKHTRIQSAVEFLDHLRSALRPRASISLILSQGSLADLHLSLAGMRPEDYAALPIGQRALIMTRLKDLIRVDDHHMRNPIASLLSALVRLSFVTSMQDYRFIIEQALRYGYEVKYSEQWRGNIAVRSALNSAALVCPGTSHKVLAEQALDLWRDIDRVADQEAWYTHDLRIFLQNLLVNEHCGDDVALELATRLDRLNELTH